MPKNSEKNDDSAWPPLRVRAAAVLCVAIAAVPLSGCGEPEPPEITEDVSEEVQRRDAEIAEGESEL